VRKALLVALVLLGLAAAAAAARVADTPGVTANQILIGGTAPLSGEASSAASVARGAEAYLNYVNDRGGVNGRKVVYKYLDDAYQPNQTVQAVRQLVQQDNVFAIFNTLGTANNLAIRDFLNQSKVPQLFAASGANTLGADYKRYPYTIGFIPSYVAEGTIYGGYVARTTPNAKVAVLYQDDDYGRDLLNGVKRGLAKVKLAAAVGYDPTAADVQSQIAQLRASKADTVMVLAFGKFAVQAFAYMKKLGWKPKQVFVNAVASSAPLMTLATFAGGTSLTNGVISIAWNEDPSDPEWAAAPGVRLFQAIRTKYLPAVPATDGYALAGMASAFTLVDVLKKAGSNLTREAVVAAAGSLNEVNPFLIPGIVVKTSAADHFPVEQAKLERWNAKAGHWTTFGPVVTAHS
jgi:branched-chain amino acid transport system substrate-binding protein